MATIVVTAERAGNFKTLIAALEEADLIHTLEGPGPFTVFAPEDNAFSRLPESTMVDLLRNIPRLKQVLLNHVVHGDYTAEDIADIEQLQTVQGQNLVITTQQGSVKVNNASVIQSDIDCDNGIIHVIDTVIMPKVEARRF